MSSSTGWLRARVDVPILRTIRSPSNVLLGPMQAFGSRSSFAANRRPSIDQPDSRPSHPAVFVCDVKRFRRSSGTAAHGEDVRLRRNSACGQLLNHGASANQQINRKSGRSLTYGASS